MGQVIVGLAIIGITIYALIDCLRSDQTEIRALPKPLWLLVILLGFPPVGGVLWILLGHQQAPGHASGRGPRVVAPDDDPDFLRSLDPPSRPPRKGETPPDASA